MKILPLVPSEAGPLMMGRRDLSMGLPTDVAKQAARTVAQLAKMEAMRQVYVTKGYSAAAAKTLQGMGALFAAGPTTEEMQGYLKNRMVNGGIVSGRDYYDRIQKGLSTSYSHTSNTPENLKAYAQRAADRVSGAVPASLSPYIRPSIQAASYVYATKQEQQTGAALAGVPNSVVERERMRHKAMERATYLMGLAGLAGDEKVDVPDDIVAVLAKDSKADQAGKLYDEEQWALKQYATSSESKKKAYRDCIADQADDAWYEGGFGPSSCREKLEPAPCPAGNYAKNPQVTEAEGGLFSGKKFYGWTGTESCVYASDPRAPGGDTGKPSDPTQSSEWKAVCGSASLPVCLLTNAEKALDIWCKYAVVPDSLGVKCPAGSPAATGNVNPPSDSGGGGGMDTTTVIAIVGGVAVLGVIAALALRKRG